MYFLTIPWFQSTVNWGKGVSDWQNTAQQINALMTLAIALLNLNNWLANSELYLLVGLAQASNKKQAKL